VFPLPQPNQPEREQGAELCPALGGRHQGGGNGLGRFMSLLAVFGVVVTDQKPPKRLERDIPPE
jgi:hypothetical protein